MPTLSQQRSQIRKDIENARKPTASDERKALGKAMVARRRGKPQVDDAKALLQEQQARRQLSSLATRGTLPPQKGRGNYTEPRSSPGGGAGIASPLVETDYNAREYWPEQTLVSVDGLLSFRVRPIKSISQEDANAASVVQQFAQPVAVEP